MRQKGTWEPEEGRGVMAKAKSSAKAKGYDPIQIALHWAMALMIASQFVLSWLVLPGWHYLIMTHEYLFTIGVAAHLSTGTTLLALVLWRIQVRWRHQTPAAPEGFDPRLEAVSHLVHWATYATMVLIPMTGLLAYFGDLRSVATVHNVLAVLLLGLVGIHAAGALYHQFIRHDGLLLRMIRSEKTG
jgi:cytochrome b561